MKIKDILEEGQSLRKRLNIISSRLRKKKFGSKTKKPSSLHVSGPREKSEADTKRSRFKRPQVI